jgi:hypothetical protein
LDKSFFTFIQIADLKHLPQPLPRFALPLQPGDGEPIIDLRQLLELAYDRAGYDVILDYQEDVVPPLAPEAETWLKAQLL